MINLILQQKPCVLLIIAIENEFQNIGMIEISHLLKFEIQ